MKPKISEYFRIPNIELSSFRTTKNKSKVDLDESDIESVIDEEEENFEERPNDEFKEKNLTKPKILEYFSVPNYLCEKMGWDEFENEKGKDIDREENNKIINPIDQNYMGGEKNKIVDQIEQEFPKENDELEVPIFNLSIDIKEDKDINFTYLE